MQTARYVLPVCCLLLVLAGLVACTQTPPPTRQEVLASLADDLIVPRYQSVSTEMGQLRDVLDTLCANPTPDTLASARTAWREARAPWMRSQATCSAR